MTKTTFRWEQDGAGGLNGTATYFPGETYEATVHAANFREAHDLEICIRVAIKSARRNERAALLAEIQRLGIWQATP